MQLEEVSKIILKKECRDLENIAIDTCLKEIGILGKYIGCRLTDNHFVLPDVLCKAVTLWHGIDL